MADEAVVLNTDVTETKVNADENAKPLEGGDQQANANEGEAEQEHKRRGGWARKTEKAERERDFWREEALRSRQAQPQPVAEVRKPAEEAEPEEKDFATLGEYLKAARAFDRKQVKREIEAENQAREREGQARSRNQSLVESWQSKVAAARNEYSDFDDVALAPDVPYSPAMTEAVAESDEAAKIAYFLGQNLKEAERISKLSPLAAAKEIGKLEARFAKTEQAEGEEKPDPPQTRAPKPPTPITKPSAAKAPSIHDPDLAHRDYVKLREAQKKG